MSQTPVPALVLVLRYETLSGLQSVPVRSRPVRHSPPRLPEISSQVQSPPKSSSPHSYHHHYERQMSPMPMSAVPA